MTYRVKVEYDECPDYSWLEQWDTPEKYYGGAPKCPICGDCYSMRYLVNHDWECPDCECRHTWTGGEGGQVIDPETKERMPFEDYKAGYGDPNRYVFLVVLIERQCGECHGWSVVESLGGVDIYEGSDEHWETGTLTPEEVDDMPEGYLRETIQDLVSEWKDTGNRYRFSDSPENVGP